MGLEPWMKKLVEVMMMMGWKTLRKVVEMMMMGWKT